MTSPRHIARLGKLEAIADELVTPYEAVQYTCWLSLNFIFYLSRVIGPTDPGCYRQMAGPLWAITEAFLEQHGFGRALAAADWNALLKVLFESFLKDDWDAR